MKKIISTMLILLVLMTMLAGCNGGKEDISEYIELKGDVKGIEYVAMSTEVTQDDIDAKVNEALDSRAYGTMVTEFDRPVKMGDTISINYTGTKDGVAFEGGTAKNFVMVLGKANFVDGFESGIVGMKVGETKSVDLTFPENYYEGLAGQPVKFEITVNSIKVYPELTDALVVEISHCKTVDEYLEYVAGQLLVEKQQAAEESKLNQIWSAVVELAEIKGIPDDKYELFKEVIEDNIRTTAVRDYGMSLDDYIKSNYGSQEIYEKNIDSSAKAQTEEYLIIAAIAREKGLEMSEDEYDSALKAEADAKKYSVEEYKEVINMEYFKIRTLSQKVREYLVNNAVEKGDNK